MGEFLSLSLLFESFHLSCSLLVRESPPSLGFFSPLAWRAAAAATPDHRSSRRLHVLLLPPSLSAAATPSLLDLQARSELGSFTIHPSRLLQPFCRLPPAAHAIIRRTLPASAPHANAARPKVKPPAENSTAAGLTPPPPAGLPLLSPTMKCGDCVEGGGCLSFLGEKRLIWICDPGINKKGVDWSQIVVFKNFILDESTMSYKIPMGLNKQDKEFDRHFVGEIKFAFESGFWAIKNLKDALQSSILLYGPLNHCLEFGCRFQKRMIGFTVLVLIALFSGLLNFHDMFLFRFDGLVIPLLYLDSFS